MSEYTPTTEEVREAISEWAWARRMFRPELGQSDGLEADRWLAAHDAEVQAQVVAEEPEERWQYGAQNPDDADGKIIAWSRGFTKRLVEQQGHRLFRRTPGVPAGPWVPVKQEGAETDA